MARDVVAAQALGVEGGGKSCSEYSCKLLDLLSTVIFELVSTRTSFEKLDQTAASLQLSTAGKFP